MIRLSKRIRIAVLSAAGLVTVGTGAGTAAAVAAASSPAGTAAMAPATMTAAMKVQPSQAAPRTTTVKTATPAKAQPATPKSPQQIATSMLRGYGWAKAQFSFLDQLWHKESNWNASAVNASSGAYGIAQALPASQMSSAGPDWHTNAATQIKWGLNYIKDRYGSPQAAWTHEMSQGWY